MKRQHYSGACMHQGVILRFHFTNASTSGLLTIWKCRGVESNLSSLRRVHRPSIVLNFLALAAFLEQIYSIGWGFRRCYWPRLQLSPKIDLSWCCSAQRSGVRWGHKNIFVDQCRKCGYPMNKSVICPFQTSPTAIHWHPPTVLNTPKKFKTR